MNSLCLFKLSKQQTLTLMLIATGITCTTVFYGYSVLSPAREPVRATAPRIEQISALGRLKPVSEVVKVSVSANLNHDRVAKLLVQRGDRVNVGQVIAILASRDRLQATFAEAEQQVALANAKLAQIRAGAKSGEILAQTAKVQQILVELQKDRAAQVDEVSRVQAQWNGERLEQEAKLSQVRVELQNDRTSQNDEITRVQAQWDGDRATQSATIQRFQASLQNAQSEFDRNRQLQVQGAISTSVLDTKKLAVDTAQQQLAEAQATLDRINRTSRQQLNQAQTKLNRINSSGAQQLASAQAILNRINLTGKQQLSQSQTKLQRTNSSGAKQVASARATLAQISEVRGVDVQVAQAEVNRSISVLSQAQANLAEATIRAPIAGRIFEIHTKAGETVGSNGIVELGQPDRMEVVTEVYQTDISKIRSGQSATITSESFTGEVRGTVRQIGLQVKQQAVSNGTPGENLDRRVVEVRILLNPTDTNRVQALTNLQVQVAIKL